MLQVLHRKSVLLICELYIYDSAAWMKLKTGAINFSFPYPDLQYMIRPKKDSVLLLQVKRVRIASNVNVIGIIYGAQNCIISTYHCGIVISNS
jgi:hypothetical protein